MPIKERSHAMIRQYRVNLTDLDSDYRCITTKAEQNKVRKEFPEFKKPAIIAVMGLPHTGRESICDMLSPWLRSPVFNIQAPLDALERRQTDVNRLCFNIVCQMAEHYLSSENFGINCAIVTSTFFDYTWQIDRLLGAITQGKAEWRSPRLLIVECRRKNRFQWQMSFKNEQFRDVDKANQQLKTMTDDCFVAMARSNPDRVIKKLVVDPFEDISHSMSELGGCGYSSLFTRAIENLLSSNDDVEVQIPSSVVYYDQWRRQHLEGGSTTRVTADHFWCRPGGCIFNPITQNTESCSICQDRITEYRGYYCKFCSLSFHESCATDTPDHAIMQLSLSQVIMKMLKKELHHFQACYSCTDKGKRFSSFCNSCLFMTYIIKSRLLPVIFKHSVVDDHPLSLRLIDGKYPFVCTACGLGGNLASYGCHICKTQYHLECLRLPLRTENRHGGHLHSIDVHFSCDVEDDEYEWCLACYQDIDPKTWVYSCRDCDYVAHLYCAFPSIVKESKHLL